jgi:hypothetical protein
MRTLNPSLIIKGSALEAGGTHNIQTCKLNKFNRDIALAIDEAT